MKRNPIVLIGMHRSGTSLLSRLIEKQGVQMGKKKEENNESVFFQDINKALFRMAGATWDNPYNLKFIDDFFIENAVQIIHSRFKSLKRIDYFGSFKTFRSINSPWGWKDPRTTLLIDIWQRVFPDMKLVHVYRNPVDVAASLKSRQQKIQNSYKYNFKQQLKSKYFLNRSSLGSTYRCLDFHEGFKLWKEYTEAALSISDKIVHVKYEDLLSEPNKILQKVVEFLDLKTSSEKLENSIKTINASRKYAFLNDPDLVERYNELKDDKLILKLGYHDVKCEL